MKKIKLIMFLAILSSSSLLLMSLFKSPPPEATCEDLTQRNGEITILFNGSSTNPYRNVNYEYYIPTPDLRYGDVPGQNMFDPSKYLCEVHITSPNCPNFNWFRSLENSTGSNKLAIKLPPEGYEAVIKVTYYERGENYSTQDYNKPVLMYPYSRVVYQFQQTYQGYSSANLAIIYLNPSYNQGYSTDSSGNIPVQGKTSLGDLSGLNAYIDFNFDIKP